MSSDGGARTGKKKRKSKGGLIHGQPAKQPQPQQPQASAHGSQHQKSVQKQQPQPHKAERVNKDAKGAQRHVPAAAPPPQHKKPTVAESQPSSKKQKMWQEEDDDEDEDREDEDEGEEDDQYDDGDDDDDDDLVDEYGDEPEAGDDDQDDDDDEDDETERFVDAVKHGGSGKRGQKSGKGGASASSAGFAVGDRRANEFAFELEVLAARKAADVPAARPTGDDDDARGASMLEWLLAPLPVEQFFAEFWERKPLLIKRHAVAPSYHKDLFSRADLNRLLSSGAAASDDASGDADEADAGGLQYTVDLDVTSYKDGKRKTHNLDGRATLEQINNFYTKNKCSVRLLRPQRLHDGLWRVLSALEDAFQCVVGANTYLTPPNSQGFAPHYDDVEVFVCQTEGAKRWRLYAPPLASDVLASTSSGNYEQAAIGKAFADVTLETGDMLYLPRGTIHQALCAGEQHSMHATISTAQNNSHADYLQDLLRIGVQMAATQHLPLRRSVPRALPHFMGFAHTQRDEDGDEMSGDGDTRREDLKDAVVQMIGAVLDELPFDVAADQRVRAFVRERLPPVLSAQERDAMVGGAYYTSKLLKPKKGASALDAENAPKVSPGARVRFVRADCVRLLFEGGMAVLYHAMDNGRGYKQHDEQSIEFGADFGPALEHLLACYPDYATVAELPELEPEDAAELAQALLEAGLLRFE